MPHNPLKKPVERKDIVAFLKDHAPWANGAASNAYHGGHEAAQIRLKELDPIAYGRSRNHLDGAVTRLSPYIRHGVISPNTVRNKVLDNFSKSKSERFLQQLAWRDYWQRLYVQNPDWIWNSVEDYKTGFSEDDYADDLPEDIINGKTGVTVIDHFIATLVETGWLHNHARLYLSSYVCHWRRVKWQAGARWMMTHLLDGDPASNNLSWQWVASTFANKPYYFNLDNVRKYSGDDLDTSTENNAELSGSYEELHNRLFPNLEPR
jgi:deoxyribodipyrimidine photo-lyase